MDSLPRKREAVSFSMVEISVTRGNQDRVVAIACRGHAEFSDEEHGGDIVCAAVSGLTGFLGITFAEVLQMPQAVAGEDGWFRLSLSDQQAAPHQVLLEGWVRSVQQLEENYRGWVKVETR